MFDHRRQLASLRIAAADGRLDAVCERHGVVVLGAHGSAVVGDRPARDLDLAVLLRRDAPLRTFLDLGAALSGLGGGDVDLMDLRRAAPVARTQGLSGEPLYEDRSGRFAELAIAAWSERLDTSWLRRLEREVLAG